MPTYDYECQKCFHSFEKWQSIKDPLLKKCPKCKRSTLKRLIGAGGGLIFKGSGFYITDYVRKGDNGDGKKTDSKTETKPKTESSTPKKTENKEKKVLTGKSKSDKNNQN
ncbi:MAG: zinc ribbon domain-containing protein [Planctomycetes bacterium]|nr:zinc ribbon domain-containing protein [Planctomycetota bacterium]